MDHAHLSSLRRALQGAAIALVTACAACGGALSTADQTSDVNSASSVEQGNDASASAARPCGRKGEHRGPKGDRGPKGEHGDKKAHGEGPRGDGAGGHPKGPPPPPRDGENGDGPKGDRPLPPPPPGGPHGGPPRREGPHGEGGHPAGDCDGKRPPPPPPKGACPDDDDDDGAPADTSEANEANDAR